MNKIIFLILALIFLSGCSQENFYEENFTSNLSNVGSNSQDSLNCTEPYKLIDSSCCIDSNNDGICDSNLNDSEDFVLNNKSRSANNVTLNNYDNLNNSRLKNNNIYDSKLDNSSYFKENYSDQVCDLKNLKLGNIVIKKGSLIEIENNIIKIKDISNNIVDFSINNNIKNIHLCKKKAFGFITILIKYDEDKKSYILSYDINYDNFENRNSLKNNINNNSKTNTYLNYDNKNNENLRNNSDNYYQDEDNINISINSSSDKKEDENFTKTIVLANNEFYDFDNNDYKYNLKIVKIEKDGVTIILTKKNEDQVQSVEKSIFISDMKQILGLYIYVDDTVYASKPTLNSYVKLIISNKNLGLNNITCIDVGGEIIGYLTNDHLEKVSKQNFCIDDNLGVKYYCGDDALILNSTFNCQYGCNQGKCKACYVAEGEGFNNTFTLGEDETKTITIGGKSFTFDLIALDDSKLLLKINSGSSKEYDTCETFELNNVIFQINDILLSARAGVKGYVEIGYNILNSTSSQNQSNQSVDCFDSDSGRNPYQKGYIYGIDYDSNEFVNYTDSCWYVNGENKGLNEYSCNSNKVLVQHAECGYWTGNNNSYCSDGVCIIPEN